MPPYDLPKPLNWLGGVPVCTGRRVAVQALFDHLKAGRSLDEFLSDFPSVSREHAVAVIELATKTVTAPAQAA